MNDKKLTDQEQHDPLRRRILRSGAGLFAVLAASGLLRPSIAYAARKEFDTKSLEEALSILNGTPVHTESPDVAIEAPPVVEDGALVALTVTSKLPKIQNISIFVEKNPFVLAGSHTFEGTSIGYLSTRIKMAETSRVIAVVKSNGKLYSNSTTINITWGGCATS